MKTEEEITKAHDILDILIEDIDKHGIAFPPHVLVMMRAQQDVLCWILGHENGEKFGKAVNDMEQLLNAVGTITKFKDRF